MASVQSILNTVSSYLGTQDWNNYCEAFVEQSLTGHTGIYPSAASAWESQKQYGKTTLDGIQPGDTIYFAPDASNNYYGHTGVYVGNGQFVSATYQGVKQADLNQWMSSTGQKMLGYVPSGAEGRGAVKAANLHGSQINGQMALASTLSDQQVQQLQQQFAQQKQQALAEQAALSKPQVDAQLFSPSSGPSYTPPMVQQLQSQQQQQNQAQAAPKLAIPNISMPSMQSMPQQPTQYPFAQQLQPANGSLTAPKQVAPQQQGGSQGFTPSITVSRPTDYSKPQTNFNPSQ